MSTNATHLPSRPTRLAASARVNSADAVGRKRRTRRELLVALAFLLPNLLGFVVFTAGPLIYSLCASLSDWSLISRPGTPWHFVGLRNFADLITSDNDFRLYLINTVYLMIGIPISIFGSLMLAILMNQKLKGIVIYRTLFYLPTFTSGIALMILWKALLSPDFGPINSFIDGFFHLLHIPAAAPAWLASTKNILGLSVDRPGFEHGQFGLGARDALVIMGVWTSIGGSNMLLYLSALTNVPPELYEAASLDGAKKLDLFRHVTWPSLAPTTFFIVIMSLIGGFQSGFDQARVMTQGGPAGTTTTVSYYIYDKAFEQFHMGYASAVSWILFIIVLALTLVTYKYGNQTTE